MSWAAQRVAELREQVSEWEALNEALASVPLPSRRTQAWRRRVGAFEASVVDSYLDRLQELGDPRKRLAEAELQAQALSANARTHTATERAAAAAPARHFDRRATQSERAFWQVERVRAELEERADRLAHAADERSLVEEALRVLTSVRGRSTRATRSTFESNLIRDLAVRQRTLDRQAAEWMQVRRGLLALAELEARD